MKTDPITLELLYHKLKAATEEMGIVLGRTARSSYVKETNDFHTALGGLDGQFFACPGDIGVAMGLDRNFRSVLDLVPELDPGDIVITNHPYLAAGIGSHLPDVNMIKPYYHEGELICFGVSFVHCSDVGGGVPSSISPSFRSLFQEGLQIPPMKYMIRGELNEHLQIIMRSNSRVPDINDGDLQAQVAALAVGEQRVKDIIAQHGIDVFKNVQRELPEYASRRALDIQRRIPDGEYVFWDYLDDDYNSGIPVRFRCRLVVDDGHIHLDLTGTDPQLDAPYNVPTGGIRSSYFSAKIMHFLRTCDSDLPLNHGLLQNITVEVASGTVLRPEWPAPVGVRHASAVRFSDALLGCLNKASPGLGPAASGGTVIPTVVAQTDHVTGLPVVSVLQSLAGGGGATIRNDGANGRDRSLANILNTPTERGEQDLRVYIEEYRLRPDSGGPGRFRGGAGIIYSIRALQDGTQILGRGLERFVFRPWGVDGGHPGLPARVLLNRGTADEQDLGKIDVVNLREGDILTIMTPGGGGYGDPLTRDLGAVERDVRLGLVSPAAAAEHYGVHFEEDGATIDMAATSAARAEPRSLDPLVGFDPVRRRWEEIFDDAVMNRLTAVLLAAPRSLVSSLKQHFFESVVPGISKVGAAKLLDPDFDLTAAKERLAMAMQDLTDRWAAAPAEHS
jgi:N-methylhydantoinase B